MNILIFIVLVIVLVILFAVYRKSKLKERMYTWRQKALIQQMSPHFLNNSLNSINRYIFENNIESSNTYLGKFARHMQKVLHNSQFNFISLKEEIDAIQLYIELEQMRLNNKFKYDIDIDEDISISMVKIPALLLQPLVENAIWNRLSLLDNHDGMLKINIQKQNKHIVIFIMDNGISRQKALQNHKDHENISIDILKKRLSIYKKLNCISSELEYTDLFDGSGSPIGTKFGLKLRYISS